MLTANACPLSPSQTAGVSPGQFAVYEDFARCLPGFLPSATPIATTITPGAGVSPAVAGGKGRVCMGAPQ